MPPTHQASSRGRGTRSGAPEDGMATARAARRSGEAGGRSGLARLARTRARAAIGGSSDARCAPQRPTAHGSPSPRRRKDAARHGVARGEREALGAQTAECAGARGKRHSPREREGDGRTRPGRRGGGASTGPAERSLCEAVAAARALRVRSPRRGGQGTEPAATDAARGARGAAGARAAACALLSFRFPAARVRPSLLPRLFPRLPLSLRVVCRAREHCLWHKRHVHARPAAAPPPFWGGQSGPPAVYARTRRHSTGGIESSRGGNGRRRRRGGAPEKGARRGAAQRRRAGTWRGGRGVAGTGRSAPRPRAPVSARTAAPRSLDAIRPKRRRARAGPASALGAPGPPRATGTPHLSLANSLGATHLSTHCQ